MNINIVKTVFIVFFTSISISSCSQKNNIDLSDLPVINQKEVIDTKKVNKDEDNFDEFIEDLVPFKTSEKILSKLKLAKKIHFQKVKLNLISFHLILY